MELFSSCVIGSISKYIDVILNFGATQISSDSLVYQLNENNFRTVFYGDDTWLKLFPPESFIRYEGTNSFYVSDYTEVDNNVTRNVLLELKDIAAWDCMILHYLGLDHIGHIENSYSPLIHSKLQEMDAIIEQIYKKLMENHVKKGQNFLLVVTGDHGMRDMGGHGGSTKSETLVPLLTLGNDCRLQMPEKNKISPDTIKLHTERRISLSKEANKLNVVLDSTASQVDVTPTLAVLLGVPIPSCNTGKLIPKLLLNLTLSELLYAYYYNSKQVTDNYLEDFMQNTNLDKISSDHYSLLVKTFPLNDQVLSTIKTYSEFLSKLSSYIIESSTYVDTYIVFTALMISVIGTVITTLETKISYYNWNVVCLTLITLYFNSYFVSSIVLNIFISYVLSTHLNVTYKMILCKIRGSYIDQQSQISQQNYKGLTTCAGFEIEKDLAFHPYSSNSILLYLMSMTTLSCLSTSYIENEHNVWMFVFNTFLVYILLNTKNRIKQSIIIMILVIHRLLRCINMKWLDEEEKYSSTLSYWFQMNSSTYLTIFHSISLISVYLVCLVIEMSDKFHRHPIYNIPSVTLSRANKMAIAVVTTSMVCSFLYKTNLYTNITLLVALVSLTLYLVMELFQHYYNMLAFFDTLKIFVVFTILLSVLLFKPYNVLLISSLCITSNLIFTVLFPNNSFVCIFLHLCLGRIYYFLQGSTNSIATIDITVGYIGQSHYNSYIAGILIYFNMYALNFLTIFLLFYHEKLQVYKNIVKNHFKYISINVTFYLFNIYLQRNHLFIWSVFSPKLLLLSSYCMGNIVILLFLYLYLKKIH